MVNEVLLHIGMHKTGSTAIQAALKNYDDGESFAARFTETNHSRCITTIFQREPFDTPIWRAMGLSAGQVAKKAREYQRTLDHDLGRHDRNRLIISGESIALMGDPEKKELINTLIGETRGLKVFMYVRDPISFAASDFQERLKGGSAEIKRTYPPRYEYRIGEFLRSLGREKVSVHNYNDVISGSGDVVRHFFSANGLREPEQVGRSNESLSEDATKLLFALNSSNALTSGDELLWRARNRTIKQLQRMYLNHKKLDRQNFAILAGRAEVDFLLRRFNISFSGTDIDTPSFDLEGLNEWLRDLRSVDCAPMDAFLRASGVDGNFPSPNEKIQRIFLYFFSLEAARSMSNVRK